MTPIERCARALFETYDAPEEWEETAPSLRERCFKDARAVLHAIREPSEAMCEASRKAKFKVYRDGKDHGTIPRWQAMIDCALEEGQ